jgi:hypothetical protein
LYDLHDPLLRAQIGLNLPLQEAKMNVGLMGSWVGR